MTEKLDGLSKDLEHDAREKLKSVFPDCFVEGRLDIDKLLNLCGEYMTDDFERYNFTWKGKSECYQLLQKRTSGTLRPCPAESLNFETSQNLYIEGDNLEVLKLLQNSYHRQVKMIYIDPPYNTGHDFVYEDDFSEPLATYKEVIGQATKSNPETMGRFHTNWLNMMYPRLRLAANLLRDDGVIFISIDDNEQANLRKLCDEVFGEENFVAQFIWKKRTGSNDSINNVSIDHEYIICYAKSNLGIFNGIKKTFEKYSNPDNDLRGNWARDNLTCNKTSSERPNLYYPITDPKTGIEYQCNPNRVWAYEKKRMAQIIEDNKVLFPANGMGTPMYKRFQAEVKSDTKPFSSIIDTQINAIATKEIQKIFESLVFNYPKTVDLIHQLIAQLTTSSSSDIILDFFSGSGTTAHAVMRLNAEDGGNRRFIMVQLPELCDEKSEAFKAGYKNICEIGKERIRRAGQKILEELTAKVPELNFEGEAARPLDVGFKVFKLDTSNHKLWDSSPVTTETLPLLEERLNNMIDRVKPDRTDLDMIYEIMLKLGLPLTYAVIPLDIDGKRVWSLREDCLIAVCLDKDVPVEVVEKIAALAPARIIFGQECFDDMTAYSNAKLKLRNLGIEHKYV